MKLKAMRLIVTTGMVWEIYAIEDIAYQYFCKFKLNSFSKLLTYF